MTKKQMQWRADVDYLLCLKSCQECRHASDTDISPKVKRCGRDPIKRVHGPDLSFPSWCPLKKSNSMLIDSMIPDRFSEFRKYRR